MTADLSRRALATLLAMVLALAAAHHTPAAHGIVADLASAVLGPGKAASAGQHHGHDHPHPHAHAADDAAAAGGGTLLGYDFVDHDHPPAIAVTAAGSSAPPRERAWRIADGHGPQGHRSGPERPPRG